MGRAVAKALWELSQRLWGDDHPLTRARFGRYVASRGGYLSVHEPERVRRAYVRASQPGFLNRGHRKHRKGLHTPFTAGLRPSASPLPGPSGTRDP